MIISSISSDDIDKIFGNNDNKKEYLRRLFEIQGIDERIPSQKKDINNLIANTWNYDISKSVIRKQFIESDKYSYMMTCKDKIDESLKEWNELDLGELNWPFSAMNFDGHVHSLNRDDTKTEIEKDSIISHEAILFRRIKKINELRNDYIEYLIFQNENIIPTFSNSSGVDFYIDGKAYDQKVSKSVGGSFIDSYPENYRQVAIENPDLVAKSLYENQDNARFGSEPRLLIVYLDSDVSTDSLEDKLKNIDFGNPINIDFEFKEKGKAKEEYNTDCFVVLLHN